MLEALESIFTQQVDLQLVAIDDGSTDGSLEILRTVEAPAWIDYGWLSQPQLGPAAARNRGILACKHSLIAFLDCDDVLTPGALRRQLDAALQHPGQAIWGKTQWTDMRLVPWQGPEYCNWLVQLGATLWPGRLFREVGLLDETLLRSEDTDWFMRCQESGLRFLKRDDVIQLYRRHPDNLTSDLRRSQKAMVTALHRALQRRRGGSHS